MLSPQYNALNNVISGPGNKEYWNHSSGLKRPIYPEEGPFPVQGNIGSLIKNENTGFGQCSLEVKISGSPNCTTAFHQDAYTTTNTCGENCIMKYPESFGDKDFGFPQNFNWKQKVTNAHQIHALSNIRAAFPGQYANLGVYEWIPSFSVNKATDTAILDVDTTSVGNFLKLPQFSNLMYSTFNAN